jgi:hypothetical protein
MIDKRPGIPKPGAFDLLAMKIMTENARKSVLNVLSAVFVLFAQLARTIKEGNAGERNL